MLGFIESPLAPLPVEFGKGRPEHGVGRQE